TSGTVTAAPFICGSVELNVNPAGACPSRSPELIDVLGQRFLPRPGKRKTGLTYRLHLHYSVLGARPRSSHLVQRQSLDHGWIKSGELRGSLCELEPAA